MTWQQITGVSQRSTSTFYRTYECTCIVKNNATVLRVCFNGKIRGNVWRSFRAANASVTASYSWIQGWADSRNEIHIRSLLLSCHAWCVRPPFFSSFSLNRAISLLSTVLNLMAVRNQKSSRIELMTKDSGSNSRFFPPSGRLHCSQLNCTYLFEMGKRGRLQFCVDQLLLWLYKHRMQLLISGYYSNINKNADEEKPDQGICPCCRLMPTNATGIKHSYQSFIFQ